MAPNGQLLIDRDWETTEPDVLSGIDVDTVREQTQRILSDPLFHNSKRYSDMLKYIVDRTLDGQHECLKERIIGIEVFERLPDYDTSVDSIVRVAAAEIRKRLSRYYQESGRHHELRIELPTRSYVAEFKQPEQSVPEPRIAQLQPVVREQPISGQQTSTYRKQSFLRSYLWIPIVTCVLVFATWGVQHMLNPTRAIDKFWAPMLNNSGTTLIVMGSPVWLELSPVRTDASSVPPNSGMSFSQFITHQVNFPLADLSAASALTTFLARHGKDSVLRLSDSTTLSDLHGNPLVGLGSYPNEWTVRLGANLPFQFRHDGTLQWIEDTSHPADRKWMVDMRLPYQQVTSEYSVITRMYNQSTEQWWIGLGGVTVLGTLAAQQLLVDPKSMEAFSAQLPKNWERKNLQVVIETKMVNGSLGASRVVATRTW